MGIGLNHQKLEEPEHAADYLNQALNTAVYVENRSEEARILLDLAEIDAETGRFEEMESRLSRAEELLATFQASWVNPPPRYSA